MLLTNKAGEFSPNKKLYKMPKKSAIICCMTEFMFPQFSVCVLRRIESGGGF